MARWTAWLCVVALLVGASASAPAREGHPNIVFILADDLGYGDLGCYGQQVIHTPQLDRMAAEGMRFRNFYCGTCVCAPSRCVLMTGKHTGHCYVRGNASGDLSVQALRDEDVTVAEMLKEAGYVTGLCGKWGLGDDAPGAQSGLPRRQGFDHFFGYLNQVHAHNYYPEFLWRNEDRSPLANEVKTLTGGSGGFDGGYATKRVTYSHDLVADDALAFVREHQTEPFFLYLALTIPHANNEATRELGDGQEVPEYGEYAALDWPNPDKGQAAMISRMDRDVGRVLDLLEELQLAKNTVVFFASDNGPHQEGGQNPERFNPNGPLRGFKRDLYEGGIRSPLIVWWPGTTPAGAVSNHVAYFGDFLATAAELAGVTAPAGLDSLSFAPAISGRHAEQRAHDHLYWEFYERGGIQAVRRGEWKAVRSPLLTGPIELYNLANDLGEAQDVAAEHPDVVAEMDRILSEEHTPHPSWTPRGEVPKKKSPPGDGRARF
jgi:arylsulfatase A-like enzyme